MKMNWQDGAKRSFVVYPAATYKVKINDWEDTVAKTGTPQIKFKAEILEPFELQGKPITEFCVVTENSLWKIANLVACVVDIKSLPTMEVGTPAFYAILNACRGATMYWRLTQRTHKGKQTNDVEEYKRDPEQELANVGEVELDDVPDFIKNSETVGDAI